MVIEIELYLFVKCSCAARSEKTTSENFANDIPRFEDDVLFPGLGHFFARIKIHCILVKFGR